MAVFVMDRGSGEPVKAVQAGPHHPIFEFTHQFDTNEEASAYVGETSKKRICQVVTGIPEDRMSDATIALKVEEAAPAGPAL